MKCITYLLLSILTIGILLQGCNNAPDKIKIGYLPLAAGLPLYVAFEEGYFKGEGFNAELIRFASSNEVGNATTANQIDVAFVASNVIFDLGFVSKKKHKLIYTNPYSNSVGHITDYLLVRDTTQIKKIEDLKGKKIGIFPGSVVKVFCKLIFKKYGLNETDYELVELQPKDWNVALKTGQIDALSAVEPTASQIIADGIGYNIQSGFYSLLMPNVPLSAHWINEDFYKKYGKENSMKIISAYDKAIDFINSNPEKAKQYLVKYANVRVDMLGKVNLNPWTKHSEINKKDLQDFIDVLATNNAIQNKENLEDYLIK